MKQMIVAGASGFLGSALSRYARSRGWQVRALVRRAAQSPEELSWDPLYGRLEASMLANADAVVCLSGAPIAPNPWTEARRTTLVTSRVGSVGLLASAIATLPASERPTVFLTGSAVGYYGSRGAEVLTEASAPGHGFLADLCQAWEDAAQPARDAGVRTIHSRTGNVMDADAGLLGILAPLYRAHLGARLGDGHQYFPTIWVKDAAAGLMHALESPSLSGPVNLVAPEPVPFGVWHEALQEALGARSPLIAPRAILSRLGDMGPELLLTSQRVVPAALLDSGFAFEAADARTIISRALAGPWVEQN
ncbi:MAG: TIGR01777 family oxidoreductase [Bowdeniella nasicola]|nr:TIGR01777 family oxidoreductase [Bowdeniella nasicola]